MTETWKSAEEDIKSHQLHATQVSKEQPHTGVTRNGHAGVSETDQMIAMNTGGMPHSKQKTPTGEPKAPGKKEETNQVRCKAIEVEPPQLPQGSLQDPTQGETPLRKNETRTDDGNRQERHGARGATMRQERTRRPTQINGEWARSGHSQRASAKPTAEAYKATTKKERGKE